VQRLGVVLRLGFEQGKCLYINKIWESAVAFGHISKSIIPRLHDLKKIHKRFKRNEVYKDIIVTETK
jgi:hypothetical protein